MYYLTPYTDKGDDDDATLRTHKVEVSLSAQSVRDQPYHLVQCDASIDDHRRV